VSSLVPDKGPPFAEVMLNAVCILKGLGKVVDLSGSEVLKRAWDGELEGGIGHQNT
jgi:hypothetical protein